MATIYCFSSTGNSLYTSKKIAQKIGAEIKSMLIRNEKCDDDVIGFVFPCYCWGLPNSVEKFLNELEITNKNAYIFTVVTYGGTIAGIMGLVENIMKIKGLHVTYGRKIKCVENYNISFKVNNTPEMQQKSEKKYKFMCRRNFKAHMKKNFAISTPLNPFIKSLYPLSNPEKCSSKLTVSEDCTGCGICEKICPQGNITLKDGKITFNGHCEHCLGCIHSCPKQAVNWNIRTEGKARYFNPYIKITELIELNKKEKPVIVENYQH